MRATLRRLALSRRKASVAALVLLVVTAPAIVLAEHQFSDVPDDHTFHGAIAEFARAGITAGCGGGNFCPDDPVTRGQMAAFMNRGLSRTALTSDAVTMEESVDFYVAQLTVESGGVTGGTGYIIVEADVTAWTDDLDTCPCEVALWIDMYGAMSELLGTSSVLWFDVQNIPMPTGYRNGAGSVSWVFEVPTRTDRTFGVAADITRTGLTFGTGDEGVGAIVTATYVPFGTVPLVPASVDAGPRGEPSPKSLRP